MATYFEFLGLMAQNRRLAMYPRNQLSLSSLFPSPALKAAVSIHFQNRSLDSVQGYAIYRRKWVSLMYYK